MTPAQLQLAAHQIGMIKAERANARDQVRAHQQAVAELRPTAGPIYAVYPHPNKALVKALYASVREHLITRAEFAACLQNVMGAYR